jgi:hypothetical protein
MPASFAGSVCSSSGRRPAPPARCSPADGACHSPSPTVGDVEHQGKAAAKGGSAPGQPIGEGDGLGITAVQHGRREVLARLGDLLRVQLRATSAHPSPRHRWTDQGRPSARFTEPSTHHPLRTLAQSHNWRHRWLGRQPLAPLPQGSPSGPMECGQGYCPASPARSFGRTGHLAG